MLFNSFRIYNVHADCWPRLVVPHTKEHISWLFVKIDSDQCSRMQEAVDMFFAPAGEELINAAVTTFVN